MLQGFGVRNSAKTRRPYPITAYATVNGMGASTAAVARSLCEGRTGLSPHRLLELPFRTVTGTVPGDLPAPPASLGRFDSRTLRIALLALSEIAEPLRAARARWGPRRVAVILGTSTGGILSTEVAYREHADKGSLPPGYDYHAQHPFHAVADVLAQHAGLEGPRYVVSTACSSSAKVFASATRLLEAEMVDAVLLGGVDSLCFTTLRGFHSLGVLAEGPCRPFGADRPGMNIGEGAALLLLEREGRPRAMLLGAGESSDAYHMSSPHPEGRGAREAMEAALSASGLEPSDVDHINAHGTGTEHNDRAEARAIASLFDRAVPVVSTKGYTGHTLGACGSTEAIFAILTLERALIPASLGAIPPDPELEIQVVAEAQHKACRVVLSNSFAFGGSNACLALGAV